MWENSAKSFPTRNDASRSSDEGAGLRGYRVYILKLLAGEARRFWDSPCIYPIVPTVTAGTAVGLGNGLVVGLQAVMRFGYGIWQTSPVRFKAADSSDSAMPLAMVPIVVSVLVCPCRYLGLRGWKKPCRWCLFCPLRSQCREGYLLHIVSDTHLSGVGITKSTRIFSVCVAMCEPCLRMPLFGLGKVGVVAMVEGRVPLAD